MIYETPGLTSADEAVLDDLEDLRGQLWFFLRTPRRWYGSLRRSAFARAVQGSNSIEGYHASVEDVAAMIVDEEVDADEDTRLAIAGYRDALTYVVQLASTSPTMDASLLRSLHFMMLKHDLARHPGQWRPGSIMVQDGEGTTVYQGPNRTLVEPLMDELLVELGERRQPAIVRAAMAHLNLALIHPFSDGNGRMARCLQTFELAVDGVASPEFASIEEYLGRNTPAYYDVLADVARGEWSPQRSARPWLEFCLTAHLRQARTLLRRVHETEALWDACEQLADRARLPDRTVAALSDAARGWRVRRSLYVKATRSALGEGISDQTATRDLKAMVAADLLTPVGEKRGRQYQGTPRLLAVWEDIRSLRERAAPDDPYGRGG